MNYQCPHCSKPLAGNEAFCPHCGGRLTMRDATVRSTAVVAPPPQLGVAPPPIVAPGAGSRLGRVMLLFGVVVLLGVGYIAWNGSIGVPSSVPGAGAATTNLPPSGVIWFGSSFNTTTFAISGRSSSVASGTTVALVASLGKVITLSQANLRISVDGTTIANSALNISGDGDTIGLTYSLPVPGSYSFAVTDIGGNVLASGSITAT